MVAAWKTWSRPAEAPPELLPDRWTGALAALARAVDARNPQAAGHAALRVAQSALDLELRYRPVADIDRARFELWARQLVVDAADGDPGLVAADVATLELIRDRVRHTLHPATAERVSAGLAALGKAVEGEDLRAAAAAVPALRDAVAAARP